MNVVLIGATVYVGFTTLLIFSLCVTAARCSRQEEKRYFVRLEKQRLASQGEL